MSKEQFIEHARSLKGAKWRHRGRKPWGVDCIGLLVLSAQASGLEVDDPRYYGREPWDDQLRKELQAHFGEPVTEWDAGDIALIRWRTGDPSHVGIIADHPGGGLSLLHVHNLHGVVEQGLSGPLRNCVIAVYRPWQR